MAKTPRKRKTRRRSEGNPLVPRHREGRAIGRARGKKRATGPAPAPDVDLDGGPRQVRLNKFLADHGIASRRKCDELIEKGKVSVDGVTVTELGTKVDPEAQAVEVDGVTLKGLPRRYYLLNKPGGVVCTNEEREQRPRAVDLITDRDKGRIYTVGRLDEESTGLILLTNDGDFANRVMHPRFGVHKTYSVRVVGRIDDEALNKVRDGVHLAEGRTGGARILVKRRGRDSSTLDVTIREGMNREIRRAFAGVGYKVVALRRTRIGTLDSRGLKTGRWRKLTRAEIEELLNPREEAHPIHGGPEREAGPETGRGAERAETRKPRAPRRTKDADGPQRGRRTERTTGRRPGAQGAERRSGAKGADRRFGARDDDRRAGAKGAVRRSGGKSADRRFGARDDDRRAGSKGADRRGGTRSADRAGATRTDRRFVGAGGGRSTQRRERDERGAGRRAGNARPTGGRGRSGTGGTGGTRRGATGRGRATRGRGR